MTLHCFTLPSTVLYLVGVLAVPGVLQGSVSALSHSSMLIKYYDLTTLISVVSDFIGLAICSNAFRPTVEEVNRVCRVILHL